MSTEAGELLELFGVESLWSDQHRLLRDSVRQFARNVYGPQVVRAYAEERFPAELIGPIGASGVLGANLKGHGCAGLDAVGYGLAMRELEYVDSGLRSFASVQGALCMYPIATFGSETLKSRLLPKMATGEWVGCFGLSEPDSGSDPGSMTSLATRVSDGWIINARKMWITNAPIADVAIVWAKTRRDDPRSIRGFVIERGASGDGLSTPTMSGKLSFRGSSTGEIIADQVFVADSHVLDVEGLKGPLRCLTQARFGITWGALGAALCCYETALTYVRGRRQFGRPIAGFQLTQAKLAEMASELVSGHLLAHHLAKLKDAGELTGLHVSLGKRDNVARALRIARMARNMMGANGIMEDYPVARHAANLEAVYTYEGTHEIHTLAIGRALTGLSAFGG